MDTHKQFPRLNYTRTTLPPAQLFVGKQIYIYQQVQQFLMNMLCAHHGCTSCTTCKQISNQQHHSIIWFYTEKNYTIDAFDDLFSTIILSLEKKELFFFIIQKADALTPASANKLLKSMEEPPAGYHFILLAERLDAILPTIRSRCTIQSFNSQTTRYMTHQLFTCFTTQTVSLPDFTAIIDSLTINEYESIELLDAIIEYWINEYKIKNVSPQIRDRIALTISLLRRAYTKTPMPGSSILFWKNLYLQLLSR